MKPESAMPPIATSWRSGYRNVRIVLHQLSPMQFEAEVGEGCLTYFYPLNARDFCSARLEAFDHALRFRRNRPAAGLAPAEPVVALEWEEVTNGAGESRSDSGAASD